MREEEEGEYHFCLCPTTTSSDKYQLTHLPVSMVPRHMSGSASFLAPSKETNPRTSRPPSWSLRTQPDQAPERLGKPQLLHRSLLT